MANLAIELDHIAIVKARIDKDGNDLLAPEGIVVGALAGTCIWAVIGVAVWYIF